ncbi:aldo/keto reductase [Serinibacter salmoneus]|uniref:Aryl-alcohol dehydrogenase-like predicted oxidoreductase n=1 Tax=Serinibacter salmoneus TaxID=556530 RepID=A0A2A9D064_9MICO|nr:aldo/keto reductase [Serinibacter salmoneus]PFG19781.1 aryl-alcohol dehydrogenase-like predicted oxidoreductase [Serinibacter salmoneus]
MQPRRSGSSGLSVSPVGLGTMTWGRDTDRHEAADLMRLFLDAGGSLLDTASSDGSGAAEEVVGDLLSGEISRREVVLCGKSGVRHGAEGISISAARGALLDDLDATLARLRTDHLDLWLVQAPDGVTPAEETVSALCDAVRSGRTRYVGLANHAGWETAQRAVLARQAGVPLAAAQVEYSLLQRGAEREVIPAAQGLGLGVIGWSGLGRGVLTGKYRRVRPADSRAASPHLRAFVEPYLTDDAARVVEAVATAADGLGCTPAQVALAWARQAPGITSVLIGPRAPGQLAQALEALDLVLPQQIRDVLDEVTQPALGYPERR